MTKGDWVDRCGRLLCDRGVENFSALEICDVGREKRGPYRSAILRTPPLELLENVWRLIDVLEWLREKNGTTGVLINSWYRDSHYNAAVGGVAHSMHLTLGAADIVKVGWTPSDVADLLEGHAAKTLLGIGRYKSFTHVDIRGMIGRSCPARWGTNE